MEEDAELAAAKSFENKTYSAIAALQSVRKTD